MCVQDMIFQPFEANAFKAWLKSLPREEFFFEASTRRWGLHKVQPLSHRYMNPEDSWFPVTFDAQGAVMDEKISVPFCRHGEVEVLKQTIHIALKWMAKQNGWESQTRQMAMSIMQHHDISMDSSSKPIPWHRDASDHTLVVLLDDETQWQGGDFLFKICQTAAQRFKPKLGYGVFFSNHASMHSVEPFVVKNNHIDRTIFTLHEKQFVDRM